MTKEAVVNEPQASERIVGRVRERYGEIARSSSSCCAPSCCDSGGGSTALGYDAESLRQIPADADLGLGCGAPVDRLDLAPGETVLDLGSGGGIDVFLAARQVGPTGRAIGVDMTPEMLERARAAASKAGFDNVEFRHGRLESLPLNDSSVDAVTSNCVINLVPDKAAVFAEVARVLRPGGRLVVSDIVLERELPEAITKDLMAWVGCVAGAQLRGDYFAQVEAAGLGDVEILRDVDALAMYRDAVPKEVLATLAAAGVDPEDLAGQVRSVTYRAVRQA
jgi:SAM-dependent methyltransferase